VPCGARHAALHVLHDSRLPRLFSLSWGIGRTVAPAIIAALLWLGPTWPWIGLMAATVLAAAMALRTDGQLSPERQRMPGSVRYHELSQAADEAIAERESFVTG